MQFAFSMEKKMGKELGKYTLLQQKMSKHNKMTSKNDPVLRQVSFYISLQQH